MISVMTKSTEKIYESRYRTVSILRIRAWILSKSPMCASSQQTCVLTFGAQCIPKVFLASFTAERSHKASWRGAILSKKRLAYGIGWASIHASGYVSCAPEFSTPLSNACQSSVHQQGIWYHNNWQKSHVWLPRYVYYNKIPSHV